MGDLLESMRVDECSLLFSFFFFFDVIVFFFLFNYSDKPFLEVVRVRMKLMKFILLISLTDQPR